MTTDIAHETNATDEKLDYVYSLHGIRTNAFWQSRLVKEIADRTGFKVGARNYMRFDILMFLFKNIFAHQPLRLVEGDILELQKRYRVSVIAHSFGTWLLFKALCENGALRVHHVILCGSVFPRASAQWRQFKHRTGQITGDIVNFCGVRDPFPAFAELLSRDFGAAGVVGAGDPDIADSFHDVGHSGFLTSEFCSEYWVPILQSKPCALHPAPIKPRWYIPPLLWAAAHRGVVLIAFGAVALAGYSFYRSEYSCWLRPCYVDIVRVHNYKSSTRQPDSPRRYVNQVTFEYTYNFDRSELVFRAPADRNAVVTSLIGDSLERIKPQESSERLNTGNDVANRKFLLFKIPVQGRRATFSAEFANDSGAAPSGVEVFADTTIRDLKLQIFLPDQATLRPPKDTFSRGVLINREPREDIGTRNCVFDADGRFVRCRNLNIPSKSGFFYCFDVGGWNGPQEMKEEKVEGCKP